MKKKMVNSEITDIEVLTVDQFTRILSRINNDSIIKLRDKAIIMLLFCTFVTIHHILAMKTSDVDLSGETVSINLNKSIIDCNPLLGEYLAYYIKQIDQNPSLPLFRMVKKGANKNEFSDRDIDPHTVRRRITLYSSMCGFENINSNSIRLSGMLHHFKNGGNINEAANIANCTYSAMARYRHILAVRGLLA
jgi:integrase